MSKFLERFPLYPFLAALYPVLYLVSVNIGETTPLAFLFFLTAVSILKETIAGLQQVERISTSEAKAYCLFTVTPAV